MSTVPTTPVHVTVAGRLGDYGYHMAHTLAGELADAYEQVTYDTKGMMEADWERYLQKKQKAIGGDAWDHKLSPLVFYNGRHYIGGVDELQQWAADVYHFVRRPNRLVHMRGAGKELQQHMEATGHDFAFMDVAVGKGVPERVLFELFTDTCPKTCANFLALCTGDRGKSEAGTTLHYKDNLFHRVVPKAWVQAGDIVGGRGNDGESVYGPAFADESFVHKHDKEGMLAMANHGRHTNNSQFYVTLAPLSPLDGKHVVFGRVVSGMRAVRVMERVECVNQRPVEPIRIVDCGRHTFDGGRRASMRFSGPAQDA